ncbi:unnamed protein product [Bemisia tabaci]|uniref:RNA 3'-terminal phosphate cyclase-like protein n=1 Tax=Bemisia tabaci TaxID=7038 RepID=A0A9N9ZZ85_BEMTA|nr:PREDICTED: RNA 3'-terminal phosphate cyclase-like protein [Bemisia tabaci]CAH0380906.1 unnamed protein product [Bemisia tabaci]
MKNVKSNLLEFKGSNFFRQRLILSVLSAKPIRITDIRSKSDEPGLAEFEINLLRLIDKLTNGTVLEVNETGTTLYFQPGMLTGGKFDHECCKQRAIGYYFEAVLAFAPFCKKALEITLRGVTNNKIDPSVDSLKTGALPLLRRFLIIDPGIDLKIRKRGMEPEGGGEIHFVCPNLKQLKPIQIKDFGKIKRIRGTAFSLRTSPVLSNRVIDGIKSVLLNFIPDVFITVDHLKGQNAGKSPGFGASLVAESTAEVFYTADQVCNIPPEPRSVPEDLGKELAFRLCEEISRGGCVDSSYQSLVCLWMALHQKDVSQCLFGPLSPYTIQFLRHLKEFFGVTFKLEPFVQDDEDDFDLKQGSNKVLVTCVGTGFNKIA